MTERTVVDVVVQFQGVLWVVNNERAPQSVAILTAQVAVVPECTYGRWSPIRTEHRGLFHTV